MVEVCIIFCYCLLWLDALDNRCMFMEHVCFMSVIVTVGMFNV